MHLSSHSYLPNCQRQPHRRCSWGWGDWGKSEMSGGKVQSWRMGVSYWEMSQDIWCWFGGKAGITEQEQTVEERREGPGGLRGVKAAGCAPVAPGWGRGANGQGRKGSPRSGHSSVRGTLAWEGDRSLTVGPPRNSEGEELGRKVQEKGEELGRKVQERGKKRGVSVRLQGWVHACFFLYEVMYFGHGLMNIWVFSS